MSLRPYADVETIVDAVVTDEEMGLKKANTFSDLLLDAVNQAKKLPHGRGVRLVKMVPIGSITGYFSRLRAEGRLNGEVEYFVHKGSIFIRKTH